MTDDIENHCEELVFNPYNPNNNEITSDIIQSILVNHGLPKNIKINNIELYKRAFIHKSYTKRPAIENKNENIRILERPNDCLPLKSKSNERLEFLGDGVLECITKYYLYKRFPKCDEGFMTEKKICLVKNEHIGILAYKLGLHKHYIISKHAEEKNIRNNLKKLGCLFEAFIAALFLDCNKVPLNDDENIFNNLCISGAGFQSVQIFIENIFEKYVDWTKLIQNDDNYKNKLQVFLQKEFKITPNYICLDNSNEIYNMAVYLCKNNYDECNHEVNIDCFNKISDMHLYFNKDYNILLGKGSNKIKKKAEQEASSTACNYLFNLD